MSTSSPSAAAVPSSAPGIRRVSAALPPSFWVFADQGVVSIANFATSIFIGRCAGQEQLGFYILAYSLYLTALGLAKAIVWTPYTKNTHHLAAEDRPSYAGSATVHLIAFVVAFALGLATAGLVARSFAGGETIGNLFLVLAPCSVLMLLREHVRRLCLASLAVTEVFLFDLAVMAAQIAGLVWLATTGRISAINAILAVAIACSFSIAWLLWRRRRMSCSVAQVKTDWLKNWELSKWLTGGALSVLIGNQGYRWLLPVLTNMAELGKLGSAQSAIQFANPLILGVSNYLGPVTARVHAEQGLTGLWRHTIRHTLIVAAFAVVLLLGLAWIGEAVVQAIYLDAANGVTRLLLLTLGAGMMSEVLLVPIEFASINCGRGRLLMASALLRLAVNLTIGFALVWQYGAIGIGVGMLIGCSLSIVWQWIVLSREVHHA